eukprot:GHRQ01039760.1.p3 GENE.GHRQ01039760.1~~GHRQ01039760.1.p3  ORF type:complete len:118 (-),score=2.48 GHRQ01039760.1:352-705(-)
MRLFSSGSVGLWSWLTSTASQPPRLPWRPSTMRLSPTQAVVRVVPWQQGQQRKHPCVSYIVLIGIVKLSRAVWPKRATAHLPCDEKYKVLQPDSHTPNARTCLQEAVLHSHSHTLHI